MQGMVVGLLRFGAQQRQHPDEEDRHEDHPEHGRAEHPAQHPGAQCALARSAGASGDGQRHHAEHERHGGHDDRAETQARGFDSGIAQRVAVFPQVLGELDDENGVLRRQADHGDQADLEVHVVGQADGSHRQYRAECADRHDQHHRQRDRPALVERHQQQEHHGDGQREQHRRLAAGDPLLIRKPGPLVADTFGQLGSDALQFEHRLASAHAGRGVTGNADRRVTVVTRDLHRAFLPARGDESTQRYQAAAVVGHMQAQDAFRRHALGLFGLYHHALLAAGVGEVVDHRRAERSGQRAADRFEADTQRAGLLTVDHQAQLRRLGQTFHHGVEELRIAVDLAQHFIARCQQGIAAETGAVLQAQGEATGVTKAFNRRWWYRHDCAVIEVGEVLVDRNRLGFRRLRRITLRPVLEQREGNGRVLAHAGEAEAKHQEGRLHGLAGHQK